MITIKPNQSNAMRAQAIAKYKVAIGKHEALSKRWDSFKMGVPAVIRCQLSKQFDLAEDELDRAEAGLKPHGILPGDIT